MARPFTDIKLVIDGYFVKSRLKNCNYLDCIYHDLDTMQCELKEITMNEDGQCINATFDSIKQRKRMGKDTDGCSKSRS